MIFSSTNARVGESRASQLGTYRMSLESSRPISTTQTAIKASRQSLEALGSKQLKLRTSSPEAWLPNMFMES